MDFGYWAATELGLPLDKVSRVAGWRSAPEQFSEIERLFLAYAEAMTDTRRRSPIPPPPTCWPGSVKPASSS